MRTVVVAFVTALAVGCASNADSGGGPAEAAAEQPSNAGPAVSAGSGAQLPEAGVPGEAQAGAGGGATPPADAGQHPMPDAGASAGTSGAAGASAAGAAAPQGGGGAGGDPQSAADASAPPAEDPFAPLFPTDSTPQDRTPSADNPAECPAEAPADPWGPCVGLPVYLECSYGTYLCVCDWIHWICVG